MTRLLVAGAGAIGARHIAHIAEHPDLTLAGVIDPRDGIETCGAPRFETLSAATVEADGIVIAAPTQLHESLFAEGASRGLHALVEKPLAPDLAAVDRMIAVSRRTRCHILTGHHRRFHPRVQRLKTLLGEGRIGRPVLASSVWAVKKPRDYFDLDWRQGDNGSPVPMNVSHEIDLLDFLFGEITSVVALGAAPVRRAARVESGGAVIAFASGLTATVAFADTTPTPWGFEHGTGENPSIATTGQDSLRIMGTDGAIAFPSLTIWSGATDWGEAPTATQVDAPDGVPLVSQLEHFADVIAGRATPINDAATGRRTLAATLSVLDATRPEAVPA